MAALRSSLAFTQIIGVLMRSEHYKHIRSRRSGVAGGAAHAGRTIPDRRSKAEDRGSVPVAVVLWARVGGRGQAVGEIGDADPAASR